MLYIIYIKTSADAETPKGGWSSKQRLTENIFVPEKLLQKFAKGRKKDTGQIVANSFQRKNVLKHLPRERIRPVRCVEIFWLK